jgi:hypothetical protein
VTAPGQLFVRARGKPIGYEVVVVKLAEVSSALDELDPEEDEEVYEHLRELRARLIMALASFGDAT